MSNNLRRRTARGAVMSGSAQGVSFLLRIGSLVLLARMLAPGDFGLVGMVTAFTGVLGLLRDVGLSAATVQRESLIDAQTSTLFWINAAVGCVMALACVAGAPILAAFYHEPRLLWISIGLAAAFLFNGLGVQHRAILQREMRFGTLGLIDITSLVVSTGAGIGLAAVGGAHWAIVATHVGSAVAGAVGAWLATAWIPTWPRLRSGVRTMLVYGSTITVNSAIVYVAYNIDKVLLGRFWGVDALGLYGRAYQLINIPNENIGNSIGAVAFPALSRLQNEPARFRTYFLKGYALFLSVLMPITLACALFPTDIVVGLLGEKWRETAGLFQMLAPLAMVFAFINPFGWMLFASGRARRSLFMAVAILPTVACGCGIGVFYGPLGIAAGFSISMVCILVPLILWAIRDTGITPWDLLGAIRPLAVSILVGSLVYLMFRPWLDMIGSVFPRLVVKTCALFGVYLVTLLFGMGQLPTYLGVLRDSGIGRRAAAATESKAQ